VHQDYLRLRSECRPEFSDDDYDNNNNYDFVNSCDSLYNVITKNKSGSLTRDGTCALNVDFIEQNC
jgi:hypothetical protein